MTTTEKTPRMVFIEAVEAARNGDEGKLLDIGWERLECGGEVSYAFHPSELQRFAMRQKAEQLIREASYLLELANDYDGDNSLFIDEDELAEESDYEGFGCYWYSLQWISTMTDEEIRECEDIQIPFNYPEW